MNSYIEFDENVFKGKTVLLPCDDPEWSAFTKYFAQNFERLGLEKLISTSYAPDAKPKELNLQPTLFEIESPNFDESKSLSKGKIFTLVEDISGDNRVDVEDLRWDYLEGDGDFRSSEITALRDEADLIVTNPPFSLFREFVHWIHEAKKDFVVLGNVNSVTYTGLFPLIQSNEMWLGVTRTGLGSMWFRVADAAPDKTGQKVEGGQRFQTVGSSAWFTNLDHGRRHLPLPLMTESDNIKFSKHKDVKGFGYKKYDNYDAIDVPHVDAIPSDYKGVMGVPITFLSKYNPEQFEIIGSNRGVDQDPNGVYGRGTYIDGKETFKRLFIRHRGLGQ